MKVSIICILTLIGFSGLSFLITAGLVWVGCWALGLLGITVAWSWTISLAIWLLAMIIKSLLGGFKVTVNK